MALILNTQIDLLVHWVMGSHSCSINKSLWQENLFHGPPNHRLAMQMRSWSTMPSEQLKPQAVRRNWYVSFSTHLDPSLFQTLPVPVLFSVLATKCLNENSWGRQIGNCSQQGCWLDRSLAQGMSQWHSPWWSQFQHWYLRHHPAWKDCPVVIWWSDDLKRKKSRMKVQWKKEFLTKITSFRTISRMVGLDGRSSVFHSQG